MLTSTAITWPLSSLTDYTNIVPQLLICLSHNSQIKVSAYSCPILACQGKTRMHEAFIALFCSRCQMQTCSEISFANQKPFFLHLNLNHFILVASKTSCCNMEHFKYIKWYNDHKHNQKQGFYIHVIVIWTNYLCEARNTLFQVLSTHAWSHICANLLAWFIFHSIYFTVLMCSSI